MVANRDRSEKARQCSRCIGRVLLNPHISEAQLIRLRHVVINAIHGGENVGEVRTADAYLADLVGTNRVAACIKKRVGAIFVRTLASRSCRSLHRSSSIILLELLQVCLTDVGSA